MTDRTEKLMESEANAAFKMWAELDTAGCRQRSRRMPCCVSCQIRIGGIGDPKQRVSLNECCIVADAMTMFRVKVALVGIGVLLLLHL